MAASDARASPPSVKEEDAEVAAEAASPVALDVEPEDEDEEDELMLKPYRMMAAASLF